MASGFPHTRPYRGYRVAILKMAMDSPKFAKAHFGNDDDE